METMLPKAPLGNLRLLKKSLVLYKKSFIHVITLSFLLAFTAFIPRILSELIGQDLFVNLPPESPMRLWLIVIDIAAIIFFIGIIWRMHCITLNTHERLLENVRIGIKKIISALVAVVIHTGIIFSFALIIYGFTYLINENTNLLQANTSSLALTAGIMLALLWSVIYVSTLFVFLIPLIAVENQNVLKALEKSVLIGWNHAIRILIVQLIPWICYLLTLIALRNVFNINVHIYFLGNHPHSFISTIVNLLMFTIFIPWSAATLLLQLNDLELRRPNLFKNDRKKRSKTE